ncbi:MAG TPA: alanine racemase [Chloroflexota bacterium]|nr:alanine racemase [Chloroflexota bacterium]
MFLERLRERNPRLLATAIELHQSGRIPPSTYVIDLDTVAENARALASEARRLGLTTYLMTKQYARNPYVTWTALANGLYKTVAVDMPGALQMRRYGIPVGHMGHLNQIPRHQVAEAVALRPDVITVYNLDHARWIDQAAGDQGVTQDLLIRVYAPGDIFFEGQEGGFAEENVPDVARAISQLDHVRLVGVTAFPCVRYNTDPDQPPVELTPNFQTIMRAADRLRQMGYAITQINAPGNTSSLTMPILAEHGATHVEPGHGLTGTTPPHATRPDLAERPAYTFVSEISHHFGGKAYAFGGGLFRDIYRPGAQSRALVGASWEQARDNALDYHADVEQIIDYHAILTPGDRATVGDTALFGFRTQMQMTRSYLAPVYGISRGEPHFDYLFDSANTALDADFNPVDPKEVRRQIEAVVHDLTPATATR